MSPGAEKLMAQARRAIARTGSGFTELQRRAVAAVCLIDGCSAEEAEGAMTAAEGDLRSRGYSLWHPSDPDAVEYAVGKAMGALRILRANATPRLRVLVGGAP